MSVDRWSFSASSFSAKVLCLCVTELFALIFSEIALVAIQFHRYRPLRCSLLHACPIRDGSLSLIESFAVFVAAALPSMSAFAPIPA